MCRSVVRCIHNLPTISFRQCFRQYANDIGFHKVGSLSYVLSKDTLLIVILVQIKFWRINLDLLTTVSLRNALFNSYAHSTIFGTIEHSNGLDRSSPEDYIHDISALNAHLLNIVVFGRHLFF